MKKILSTILNSVRHDKLNISNSAREDKYILNMLFEEIRCDRCAYYNKHSSNESIYYCDCKYTQSELNLRFVFPHPAFGCHNFKKI